MIPTLHSTNRLFEWAAAVIMIQMGLGVLLSVSIGFKVSGAFVVLTSFGLNFWQVGLLVTFLGFGRVFALYANGRWRYGCYVRAAGCAAGVLMWVQLFCGVVDMMTKGQELFIVVFVWQTFVVIEMISIGRSLRDLSAHGMRANVRAT